MASSAMRSGGGDVLERTCIPSMAEASRAETRAPSLAWWRAALRLVVVSGFVALGCLLHRFGLWGPVAVSLVAASLLLTLLFAARHVLAALVERSRLQGCSLAALDRMPGPAFEDWVVRSLRRHGFVCENLPRTRDYGIDVVATRSGRKIGVQVKRYRGAVGNGAVQQAMAGAGYHGCALAAVVTQSRFTKAARAQAAAASVPVVLIDRAALSDLGRVLRRAR
jgi:restriction system protein